MSQAISIGAFHIGLLAMAFVSLLEGPLSCAVAISGELSSQAAPQLCQAPADTSIDKTPNEVEGIYDQLEDLFLRYYPQANTDRKSGQFRASYNTRKFMIHHPLKTGEWQEAQEQPGPNRKGIMCAISYSPGRFMGAAMVPQTFNNRYFESLLMAPYNKKLNVHLVAHLDFPADASPQFLTAFNKILNSFTTDAR